MEDINKTIPPLRTVMKILLGIVGLGAGAHFFVLGAKGIAIALGVSTLVIGMSIVALGTSLPELAASMSAAKHGESDFVIGNVLGSNIINIVVVLGIAILMQPLQQSISAVATQCIFFIGLTLLLFILLKINNGISKPAGILFLIIYFAFLILNFQMAMTFND